MKFTETELEDLYYAIGYAAEYMLVDDADDDKTRRRLLKLRHKIGKLLRLE